VAAIVDTLAARLAGGRRGGRAEQVGRPGPSLAGRSCDDSVPEGDMRSGLKKAIKRPAWIFLLIGIVAVAIVGYGSILFYAWLYR
jgi:hypothetical protein